jgi:hypothetical protein
MHRGFEIDGDSGDHIRRQAGLTAAVSSGRRISGLSSPEEFSMQFTSRVFVSSRSLFFGFETSKVFDLSASELDVSGEGRGTTGSGYTFEA